MHAWYSILYTHTYKSVSQFSCSVVSDSLQPHELQHTRPPCPSPTPRVYPNLCPLSRWCHPTISSCVIPFSSCPQSFTASGSFQMSQFFTSGGQSIGVSASTSVLPMNTQDWFPLAWTGWISLQSKGLSRVFSNSTLQKHKFFSTHFFTVQLSHPYMTTGKTTALTRQTFVGKVMSLLVNMLSRLVITFLPRSTIDFSRYYQTTSQSYANYTPLSNVWFAFAPLPCRGLCGDINISHVVLNLITDGCWSFFYM